MQESLFLSLAYDALALLIPALVVISIELLRRRLGLERIKKIQEELATKQELAKIAVKFAAQAYKDLGGPGKFEEAADWLASQALAIGIKISADEIKGLIEWALREIKDELGEEWAKPLGKPV